jgi:AraC-like DNA-binding protein
MPKDKDKQNEKHLKDEFLEEFGQRLKEVRQLLKLLQKDLILQFT